MVADAQSRVDEDRRRREEVEERNNADSVAYRIERQLAELGDRAPVNETLL
jgi:molecular chaperone DnaK